jgi:hypothetical protein
MDLHFPPTISTPIIHFAVFIPNDPNAMTHRKKTHNGYEFANEAPNPPADNFDEKY